MSGYTPVFNTVFEGSLCGRYPDTAAWLFFLALADWKGEVDKTPEFISTVTGMPLADLLGCIERFMLPDPRSRSQMAEGRKLVPIDLARSWGWRVVNIKAYREKASGDRQITDGRNAAKVKRYRERHRGTPGDTGGHVQTPTHTHTHTHTTDSNKNKSLLAAAPPTRKAVSRGALDDDPEWLLDFKLAYPARAGDQKWRTAVRNANARIREGHTVEEFIAGAKRYAAFCDASGKTGTEYTKQASTFLGTERSFLLPWHAPPKQENATERILRALNGNDESRVIEHEPERNPRIQGR